MLPKKHLIPDSKAKRPSFYYDTPHSNFKDKRNGLTLDHASQLRRKCKENTSFDCSWYEISNESSHAISKFKRSLPLAAPLGVNRFGSKSIKIFLRVQSIPKPSLVQFGKFRSNEVMIQVYYKYYSRKTPLLETSLIWNLETIRSNVYSITLRALIMSW